MNEFARPHPAQVPTLTEVVEVEPLTLDIDPQTVPETAPAADASPFIVTRNLPDQHPAEPWVPLTTVVLPVQDELELPVQEEALELPLSAVPVPVPMLGEPLLTADDLSAMPALADVTEDQLARRVMGDVQRRIDGMLEFRLREAIAPLLSRHTEAMVRELRDELSTTMRDVVARAVAQEMAKLRQR